MLTSCEDEETSFPDSSCESTNDIMNEFFIDFNFQKSSDNFATNLISLDESLRELPSKSSHPNNELQSITSPTNDMKDMFLYISERTWKLTF